MTWRQASNATVLASPPAQSSLAECCHREGVSLLAYSPLAMAQHTRPPTPRALPHAPHSPVAQPRLSPHGRDLTACAARRLTSPAQGLLTGKYHLPGPGAPPEARLNLYRGRYGEAESRYGIEKCALFSSLVDSAQASLGSAFAVSTRVSPIEWLRNVSMRECLCVRLRPQGEREGSGPGVCGHRRLPRDEPSGAGLAVRETPSNHACSIRCRNHCPSPPC